MSSSARRIAVWVLLLLMLWAIFKVMGSDRDGPLVSLEALLERSERGEVLGVEIRIVEGSFAIFRAKTNKGPIRAEGLVDRAILDLFEAHSTKWTLKARPTSFGRSVVISWLPILIFIAVLFYFFRSLKRQGVDNIGDLKTVKLDPNAPLATYADIIGLDGPKAALRAWTDEVGWLASQKGPRPAPRAALIVGPAGSDRALLASAAAKDSGLTPLRVHSTSLVEMFVGVGAARIRDLFDRAAKTVPSLVIIDDIEVFAVRRQSNTASKDADELAQTMQQLAKSIEETNEKKLAIGVLMTTSRMNDLDEALTRSGLIGQVIELEQPTADDRARLIGWLLRDRPVDPSFQPAVFASETEGLTNGEVRALVDRAHAHAQRMHGHIDAAALRSALEGLRGRSR